MLTVDTSIQYPLSSSTQIYQNQLLNVSSNVQYSISNNVSCTAIHILTSNGCYSYPLSSNVLINQNNNLQIVSNVQYSLSGSIAITNITPFSGLSSNDIAMIVDAIWKHSFVKKILTIAKYIGLK